MFTTPRKHHLTTYAAFAVGLVCAAMLCWTRFGMERQNDKLTVVMSRNDAALIGEIPGVVIIDADSAENELLLYLPDGRVVAGLIEDDSQYSFLPIEGFIPDGSTDMVRVFKLFPKIAARYATLGYDGPEELVNIFCRAVVDRNIRVIWLTPYTHSETGELISDPSVYARTVSELTRRLSKVGLAVGAEFSVFPPDYTPAPLLSIGLFWGICAAVVFLLAEIFETGKKMSAILTLASCAFAALAYAITPKLTVSGAALVASIVFPCLEMCRFLNDLERVQSEKPQNLENFYIPVAISILGGLFVGALQSSTAFLLAIDNFRGVKVSQILPLVFAVYIVLRRFYGSMGTIADEIKAGRKLFIAVSAAAVMTAAVLLILRTGDGFVKISVFEQRFRNLLENSLIIRPRTKEFLIAWPCLLTALALCAADAKRYAWPFAIVTMTGFSSVVNTFCHSRAPLSFSLLRTGNGIVIGFALGQLIRFIVNAAAKGRTKHER